VPALLDQRKTGSRFSRRRKNGGSERRNEWHDVDWRDWCKRIKRRDMPVFVRFNLTFTGLVDMTVRVRSEVRVNQRGSAVVMDVLERRQPEGKRERQTADERQGTPHE
jgi:hypothetical protein